MGTHENQEVFGSMIKEVSTQIYNISEDSKLDKKHTWDTDKYCKVKDCQKEP